MRSQNELKISNHKKDLQGCLCSLSADSVQEFLKIKNKEMVSRFGGEFEEKDFNQIKTFLEKCGDLVFILENGQTQFKKFKSKIFFNLKIYFIRMY